MTEPAPRKAPGAEPVDGKPRDQSAAETPALGEPVPASQLSPEEQMARFEKELKEQDWGHQPC